MGNTQTPTRQTRDYDDTAMRLGTYCKSLETDAALVRKKIVEHEEAARHNFSLGYTVLAKQRHANSVQFRRQEEQLIGTITTIQQQLITLQTQRLAKDTMDMMRQSMHAMHSGAVNGKELDAIADKLNAAQDDNAINIERINESMATGTPSPPAKPPPNAAPEPDPAPTPAYAPPTAAEPTPFGLPELPQPAPAQNTSIII
jgi:hypothetical protein